MAGRKNGTMETLLVEEEEEEEEAATGDFVLEEAFWDFAVN